MSVKKYHIYEAYNVLRLLKNKSQLKFFSSLSLSLPHSLFPPECCKFTLRFFVDVDVAAAVVIIVDDEVGTTAVGSAIFFFFFMFANNIFWWQLANYRVSKLWLPPPLRDFSEFAAIKGESFEHLC